MWENRAHLFVTCGPTTVNEVMRRGAGWLPRDGRRLPSCAAAGSSLPRAISFGSPCANPWGSCEREFGGAFPQAHFRLGRAETGGVHAIRRDARGCVPPDPWFPFFSLPLVDGDAEDHRILPEAYSPSLPALGNGQALSIMTKCPSRMAYNPPVGSGLFPGPRLFGTNLYFSVSI